MKADIGFGFMLVTTLVIGLAMFGALHTWFLYTDAKYAACVQELRR